MIQLKALLVATLLIICGTSAFSQSQELLDGLPATKEGFIASEKKVVATIDWLENTPINQEAEKRKLQSAYLIAWITNSPTVTIEISADILTFTDKNPALMTIFMGGWTRYAIQNSYSTDVVAGSLSGIKSAIKVYKTGLLQKDREMQKLIDLDDKGELEGWVRKKLKK